MPQISMLIDKLPEEHLKMLSFYLDFWNKYCDVLLEGRLTADNPESNYSRVTAKLDDRAVITLYTNHCADCAEKETAIVNAAVYEELILTNCADKMYKITDCMGNVLENGAFGSDVNKILVPVSGMVFVV